MLKVTIERPNTLGVTATKEFESYADAKTWIEGKCERLADKGWELSELSKSTSTKGVIEATHDYEADVLLIRWVTEKTCKDPECYCGQ